MLAQDTLQLRLSTVRWDQVGFLCFYDDDPAGGQTNELNRNMVVIWLEDDTGTYVRTVHRWGRTYAYNLEDWAIASRMVVDSVSEATPRCYSGETCGSGANQTTEPAELDTGAVDISDLPDGNYQLRMEISSCEVADEYRCGGPQYETPDATFAFTKGRTSQQDVQLGNAAGAFTNIRLDYVVGGGNAPPGVWAGPDQTVIPVGTSAVASLSAIATDDGAAPSITWSMDGVEPPGGTATFSDPNQAVTDVDFTTSGIYTLRVTADDGTTTSADTVTIFVNAHQIPVEADAEVFSGNPNREMGVLMQGPPTNGAWVYSWGPNNVSPCNAGNGNRARGYFRADLSSVTGAIDLARLVLPVAEQRREVTKDHDFYILTDADDDWVPGQADDEATINWNNQPINNQELSTGLPGQLVGTYTHRLDYNLWAVVDLDLSAINANDSNDVWSFLSVPRQMCNGMGVAARENAMDPYVLVVEHWQAGVNTAPVANAGGDQVVVDGDGNGTESVTLDGSGSTDDIAVITYEWSEGGAMIATGATPSVMFGLGIHDIDLRVIDGGGLEDTASVEVEVDDRFRPNQAMADAAPIVGNAAGRVYQNLFTRSTDWYSLDLAGGGDVTVALNAAGGNLTVTLLEADGTTAVDSGATSASGTGLAPGAYFVTVDATGGDAGAATYELTVTVAGPTLTVAFDPAQASESSGVLAAGTVTLDSVAAQDVQVTLTSGDATRLGLPSTTLTVTAGQLSVSFDVEPVQNMVSDGDATVAVQASATGYNAGSADFLVIDDDGNAPLVAWDRVSDSTPETRSPLVSLKVVMSAAVSSPVTVPFTVGGSATGGEDFDANPFAAGEITIPAGSTDATLLFTVRDDDVDEPDETLVLTIGTPTGAVAGVPSTFTLTITDDDEPTGPTKPEPTEPEDSGCGCTSTRPGIGLAWWLLVLLPWFRRRR